MQEETIRAGTYSEEGFGAQRPGKHMIWDLYELLSWLALTFLLITFLEN